MRVTRNIDAYPVAPGFDEAVRLRVEDSCPDEAIQVDVGLTREQVQDIADWANNFLRKNPK